MRRRCLPGGTVLDLVYVLLTIVFFASMLGYVRASALLGQSAAENGEERSS
jgi:uncharacterized membrane protein